MTRSANTPLLPRAVGFAGLSIAGATFCVGLAAVVALAGLGRLTPDIDPLRAIHWLWYFRADPAVQRWLSIGGLGVGAIGAVSVLAIVRGLRPPLHGAARWASEAQVRAAGLRAAKGIVLGRAGGRLLTLGGTEHVALYAPTRTGKGVGVVIPNLLTWPDSVVVLDVKRENWEATAGYRAAHGQTVLLFDPLEAEGRTARFNPLGHVNRLDPVTVTDELQKLAAMLFPSPDHADPFWSEAARTGLIGVGGLIAATPDRPFSLGAIFAELTQGDPRSRLPKVIAARARSAAPLPPVCVQALTDFCSASENTFASIKQTITARMNLWLNPRVCAATDVSDFDLRDIRSRRLSLYLCVSPDNLARVAPLYSLLLQQLIDLNTRERPGRGRHQVPVLVLLDEFARLGHAPVLARAFSYVAGYGLRLLPVLQSPAQLRVNYGADVAEEIMSNCGVEIAFGPKDLKLAQELSERLGAYTYQGRSRSRPSGLSTGRRSETLSDQRRLLVLPQELLQWPEEDLIVLRAGLPPIRGRKLRYYREPGFRDRVLTPPVTPPAAAILTGVVSPVATDVAVEPLSLAEVAGLLDEHQLEPLPAQGAGDDAVEAWLDRFLGESQQVNPEIQYG